MARTKSQFRQGDVLLMLVAALPDTARPAPRENGRIVLAHGEVTGHAHAIDDTVAAPRAELYASPPVRDGEAGEFYLRVESPTGLVHEEHARVDLDPGVYKVVRQREYSPVAIRNVAD